MAINEHEALGHMKKGGFGDRKHISEAKDFIKRYNALPASKYLKGNPKEVNEKTRNGASKSKALESKKKEPKKEYTGHYQEDSSGKIRHQSQKQVEKKGLNKY